MSLLEIAIALSALLCSLVAGFLFAFAIIVMPGIRSLNDRDFLRAFKMMDAVIQNNQPMFILVWVGSVVALVISAILSLSALDGVDRLLTNLAATVYLLGVQLTTATINVPLNNRLQGQDLDTASDSVIREARNAFEARWTTWNAIRTVFAILTSALLTVVLLRI